jgi:hypothetical protein
MKIIVLISIGVIIGFLVGIIVIGIAFLKVIDDGDPDK